MAARPATGGVAALRCAAGCLLAGVLAASAGPLAAATCLGRDPVQTAAAFFKAYRDFSSRDPARLRGVVTGRFMDALTREFNCAQGEICAVDSDPWTGAQDGDIVPPVQFALASADERTSAVSARYIFALDRTRRQEQTAVLRLERDTPNACWLVADVLTPAGASTLRLIEDFHKAHGTRSGRR